MKKLDGRRNNGGHKTAGRKSKAEEIKLIEKLTPMADDAYKALRDGIKEGSFPFVKLFFEYYAGKPKETIDLHSTGNSLIDIQKLVTFNDEPSQQVSESSKE